MIDTNEVVAFLKDGMLTMLPSKRRKRLAALVWLAEHIPPEKRYTEREFNILLNKLHTFGDPAYLRRELYDASLVDRSRDGSVYWLAPERPSLEDLLAAYCGEAKKPAVSEERAEDPHRQPAVTYSGEDLAAAADFRDGIHAKALEIVRRVRPEAAEVVDRYPVEAYLQQHWDYPGAWYTIAAIPESFKSREALIDTIVRDTLAQYSRTAGGPGTVF